MYPPGSWVFHIACANLTFWRAVSAVKGGLMCAIARINGVEGGEVCSRKRFGMTGSLLEGQIRVR